MNYYAILQELAKEYPKIPMPNMATLKNKKFGGFYSWPCPFEEILCLGDFYKDNNVGTLFINEKYLLLNFEEAKNTIAHEYMHHIQHHEGRANENLPSWNKWLPYKYRIKKFFKNENELEALIYSNKKYPSKSSLKWEKWVRKNANI